MGFETISVDEKVKRQLERKKGFRQTWNEFFIKEVLKKKVVGVKSVKSIRKKNS
mgnify:CR=1